MKTKRRSVWCQATTTPFRGITVQCHRYRDHDGEHIGHYQGPAMSPFKVHWNDEAREVVPA
jgi:hypothetical protein